MSLLNKRLCFLFVVSIAAITCYSDENCETIPTEIRLTKEEYDDMGSLVRSCSGEVMVNKCEGICTSQIQPSVVTATGFLKECLCCKENYLRDRLVTLIHCYDSDGLRLEDEDHAIMEIRLREPAECRCYKCGDYNR